MKALIHLKPQVISPKRRRKGKDSSSWKVKTKLTRQKEQLLRDLKMQYKNLRCLLVMYKETITAWSTIPSLLAYFNHLAQVNAEAGEEAVMESADGNGDCSTPPAVSPKNSALPGSLVLITSASSNDEADQLVQVYRISSPTLPLNQGCRVTFWPYVYILCDIAAIQLCIC